MKALSEKLANLVQAIKEMSPNTLVTIYPIDKDEFTINISKKENMFQSRKGQIFIVGVILSTILIFFNKLDGTQFITMFMAIASIYTGGNIFEKWIARK